MKTVNEDRERIVGDIAAAINHSLVEWESGRMTSPSQLDYVIDARRVLSRYPDWIGSTPEGEEFVADVLYEDSGQRYVTVEDIAAYLYESLTAE